MEGTFCLPWSGGGGTANLYYIYDSKNILFNLFLNLFPEILHLWLFFNLQNYYTVVLKLSFLKKPCFCKFIFQPTKENN